VSIPKMKESNGTKKKGDLIDFETMVPDAVSPWVIAPCVDISGISCSPR